MTFAEYEVAVRVECISLMDCDNAEDSLDRMGDSVFHHFVNYYFDPGIPPADVAHAWAKRTAQAAQSRKPTALCRREAGANRLPLDFRQF